MPLTAIRGYATALLLDEVEWGFEKQTEFLNLIIELSGKGFKTGPEPSLGTHFFQDLMEAHIYPLAVCLDDETSRFNQDFFYQSPNNLEDWIEVEPSVSGCLRLINISRVCPGHHLEIVMDDEKGQAVGFLRPNS